MPPLRLSLSVASMFFAVGVVCMPLSDQGPQIAQGWGQVVRLRHLYTARPGLHLLINGDGQIHGSADQTLYSKLSILKLGCLLVNHTDDWRGFDGILYCDEHLNCRSAGDPSSGSRLCGHQRGTNCPLSLYRSRWKTVLIGKISQTCWLLMT